MDEFFAEEEGIGGRPEDIITESDLRTFFKCRYAYHLKKNVGMSHLPRSGYAAVAMLFENARRSLFNLRDQKTGRIFQYQHRAGPFLKTAEQMNPEELAQFLGTTPENFPGLLSGRWGAIASRGSYAGSPLVWAYDSQDWSGRKNLKEAAKHYYEFVLENGAPILGFMNKDIVFKFEGNMIKVKFPELRRPMTIDDVSLWDFNLDFPLSKFDKKEKGRSKIDNSVLATLRVLGYCSLAHEFPVYRLKWGVSDEIADSLGGHPNHLDERVTYRHLNAVGGKISTTSRDDSSLDNVRKAIDIFLEAKEKEEFPQNHSSCGNCQYNCVDLAGDVACRKRKPGSKPSVPGYYFKKSNFILERQEERNTTTLIGNVGHKGIEKTVARYVLVSIEPEERNEIGVSSWYYSDVRGIGFEVRMIGEADKELQELARVKGKPVCHELHFQRDFKFAGQKKVLEKLAKLEYTAMHGGELYVKNYEPGE